MKLIENICYAVRRDQALGLDLYLPEADRFSLFVYFHGGGLEQGSKNDATTRTFAPWLARHGIAVASVDYRMYPSARYPDFLLDAAESVCWLSRHITGYGRCDHMIVGGSSAGAYLSMMLCFDKRWYAGCTEFPVPVSGYFHNTGQPTTHFRVLQERGLDPRRVIADEASPLYHIGAEPEYPPMMFVVSDHDIPNRLEQTQLVLSVLRRFGYDESRLDFQLMHGDHCEHDNATDENGDSVLGKLIFDFIHKIT